MDWGSLIGQLGSMGASTETMNVAFEGMRQSEQAPKQTGAAPSPANVGAIQQATIEQLLSQHRRQVQVESLDLTGLWVNAQGFWLEVEAGDPRSLGPLGALVRGSGFFTYVGRNLLNDVCERGVLFRDKDGIRFAGENTHTGKYGAKFSVINEDLLACMSNGLTTAVFRRISSGKSKDYRGR